MPRLVNSPEAIVVDSEWSLFAADHNSNTFGSCRWLAARNRLEVVHSPAANSCHSLSRLRYFLCNCCRSLPHLQRHQRRLLVQDLHQHVQWKVTSMRPLVKKKMPTFHIVDGAYVWCSRPTGWQQITLNSLAMWHRYMTPSF